MNEVAHPVGAVTGEGGDVGAVPAALRHLGGQAAKKAKSLERLGGSQQSCDQPVISIENGERAAFCFSDEKHGAADSLLLEMGAEIVDLCKEGTARAVPVAVIDDPLGYLCEIEIAERKLAPLGSRKHADAIQVLHFDFGLKPLGIFGKLFPEGTVANIEERAAHLVLAIVLQVGRVDEVSQSGLVLSEHGRIEIVLEKFSDDFVSRDGSAKTDEARHGDPFSLVAQTPEECEQEWNGDAEYQNSHQKDLYPYDLRQRCVEHVDAAHDGTADYQLHPAGVRNPARHLVGDEHNTQAVHSGGQRIEHEEITKIASADGAELGAEQVRPDGGGCQAQAEHESHADAGNHEHGCAENPAVILIAAATFRRNREHAAHNRPRKSEYHASDHGYRGVNAGDFGGEEMFDDHDVAVVDDDLASEENSGLQAFAKIDGDIRTCADGAADLGLREEICHDHGGRVGGNYTSDALAQFDEKEGATQPGKAFEDEIGCQMPEIADSLDVAPAHPERDIKCRAHRQENDE